MTERLPTISECDPRGFISPTSLNSVNLYRFARILLVMVLYACD